MLNQNQKDTKSVVDKSKQIKSVVFFALVLTMLGQGAFVLYIPAFPVLSHDFHVSHASIKFTLTLFLLAYGLSQIFYGPISDRYGRKKPLVFGMSVMCIGSIWAVFSNDIVSFDLSRLVQGLGAGATMVLIRAAIRDTMDGRELARGMAFLSIGFAAGMGVFPIVGGLLTHWIAWQADFIFLTIISLILLVLVLWLLPETLILKESKQSVASYSAAVLKQYGAVLINQLFWIFLLGGVIIYSVVIAYNVMTPFMIQKELGFSAQMYGLLAIVIAIPYLFGSFLNARIVIKVGPKIIMFIGAAIVIISGLSMVIISLYSSTINIYGIMIPLFFASFGQALAWTNSMAQALQHFKKFAGVASALFSCLQLAISALVTIILALFHDHSEMPLAVVILAMGISATFLLIIGFWRSKASAISNL